MKRFAALALALAVATPAEAVMAPQYYEQARRGAPDVIVMAITRVDLPGRARYGVCQVSGRVTAVERGTRYRVGQAVRIPVHCAYRDADFPDGGTLWEMIPQLRAARTARTFLLNGAPAADAFDILS